MACCAALRPTRRIAKCVEVVDGILDRLGSLFNEDGLLGIGFDLSHSPSDLSSSVTVRHSSLKGHSKCWVPRRWLGGSRGSGTPTRCPLIHAAIANSTAHHSAHRNPDSPQQPTIHPMHTDISLWLAGVPLSSHHCRDKRRRDSRHAAGAPTSDESPRRSPTARRAGRWGGTSPYPALISQRGRGAHGHEDGRRDGHGGGRRPRRNDMAAPATTRTRRLGQAGLCRGGRRSTASRAHQPDTREPAARARAPAAHVPRARHPRVRDGGSSRLATSRSKSSPLPAPLARTRMTSHCLCRCRSS